MTMRAVGAAKRSQAQNVAAEEKAQIWSRRAHSGGRRAIAQGTTSPICGVRRSPEAGKLLDRKAFDKSLFPRFVEFITQPCNAQRLPLVRRLLCFTDTQQRTANMVLGLRSVKKSACRDFRDTGARSHRILDSSACHSSLSSLTHRPCPFTASRRTGRITAHETSRAKESYGIIYEPHVSGANRGF